MWMVEAQTSGIGVHNEEGKANAIRNVNWVIEDPRMLFDELKGKPLKGGFLQFVRIYLICTRFSLCQRDDFEVWVINELHSLICCHTWRYSV